MRWTPPSMQSAWQNGDFTGPNRPVARVTVETPKMHVHRKTFPRLIRDMPGNHSFSGANVAGPGSRSMNQQNYKDYLWAGQIPKEIPNIKSVRWNRGIETDIATCTIEIWNCMPFPVGEPINPAHDPYRVGYLGWDYGTGAFAARWGATKNDWYKRIMPDNICRVYEGYGSAALGNPDSIPEWDERLVLTGTWQIVDVEMSADDSIMTLQCEDLMGLLSKQIAVIPSIEDHWAPLSFSPPPGPYAETTTHSGNKLSLRITANSNSPWGGDRKGHPASYTLDGNSNSHWVSVGNSHPSRGFAYEYLEYDFHGQSVTLGKVLFQAWKTGYTAYLSIMQNGQWQGAQRIGWSSQGIGRNQGNIPFVQTMGLHEQNWYTFEVNQPNVTKFRITLGNLQHFPEIGGANQYRAALIDVHAYASPTTTSRTIERDRPGANAFNTPGFFRDWSDVIDMCAIWAGFWRPYNATKKASNGTALAGVARKSAMNRYLDWFGDWSTVHADIEKTGTLGPAGLSGLDGKSYLEICNEVREIVGFLLFADEEGRIIWRPPNIATKGNWLPGRRLDDERTRTSTILDIDERQTIISLRVRLSSRNVRDLVVVGDPSGKLQARVWGFNPNDTGLQRVAKWADKNFANISEARDMANMIALRGMLRYRTDSLTIAANPAIQIDDQVRIIEGRTNEGWLHYVEGISSSLDMSTGQWTYELSTHWLGDDPNGRWFVSGENEIFNPVAIDPKIPFNRPSDALKKIALR